MSYGTFGGASKNIFDIFLLFFFVKTSLIFTMCTVHRQLDYHRACRDPEPFHLDQGCCQLSQTPRQGCLEGWPEIKLRWVKTSYNARFLEAWS